MRDHTHTGDGEQPAPFRTEGPKFPITDLDAAQPFLAAPFPAASIGYAARELSHDHDDAIVNPYLPRPSWAGRLDQVVGSRNWSMTEPTFPDYRTVSQTMTICGVTRSSLGEGTSRWLQSDTALRSCLRLVGLGLYLSEVTRHQVRIGTAPDMVQRDARGRLVVGDKLLELLREEYLREISALRDRFGPILYHPQDRNDATTSANPYGRLVRSTAAGLGIEPAELANIILAVAGWPTRTPEKAAGVLDELLSRIPEHIAQQTLVALTVTRAGHHHPAPAPDGPRLAVITVDPGGTNGRTATMDQAALSPDGAHNGSATSEER